MFNHNVEIGVKFFHGGLVNENSAKVFQAEIETRTHGEPI